MTEYAPPPRKVRVTKKQLKKIQANYAKAQAMAEDFTEAEAAEKETKLAQLEEELNNLS